MFFTPIHPSGVLVLPPNNLLRSNLRSSDEIDIALSVVVLLGWEKNFEFEKLKIDILILSYCDGETDTITFSWFPPPVFPRHCAGRWSPPWRCAV